ncbi:MAG: hypothetical protein IPM20_00040 [Gammaproteobacteria bacterium]|nr:hypothetical protein [Gammaproteobacteria bacterium]
MRHRNGNFKSHTLPHQAIEFELDDFSYHIDLAMAAGSMRTPVRNPELNHVIIEDDDEVIDLSFSEFPRPPHDPGGVRDKRQHEGLAAIFKFLVAVLGADGTR